MPDALPGIQIQHSPKDKEPYPDRGDVREINKTENEVVPGSTDVGADRANEGAVDRRRKGRLELVEVFSTVARALTRR